MIDLSLVAKIRRIFRRLAAGWSVFFAQLQISRSIRIQDTRIQLDYKDTWYQDTARLLGYRIPGYNLIIRIQDTKIQLDYQDTGYQDTARLSGSGTIVFKCQSNLKSRDIPFNYKSTSNYINQFKSSGSFNYFVFPLYD